METNCKDALSKDNKIYCILEWLKFNGITIESRYKLMEVDLNYIAENAASTAIPMVFTNLEPNQKIVWKDTNKTEYQAKEDIITIQ